MSPRNFLLRCVEPGLALLPGYMVSDAARVMLMAIAGQESNWSVRAQAGGPALGYWQFESSGVAAVVVARAGEMQAVCSTLDVPVTSVWTAVQYNDPLACVVARLCLWSDPDPLPVVYDKDGAWAYYVENWKPGKPDKSRWSAAYDTAVATVSGG